MDLKGDELIAYGFKRVCEELQELRGALTEIRSALDGIGGSSEDAAKAARMAASKADKIEHNTFMLNDAAIHVANALDKIQLNTFTTELNTIQISQALHKEDDEDERMGERL